MKRENFELIISLVVIMSAILGTVIPWHMHFSDQINAIHQEMKDFHARLCAIEERGRKK